MEGFGDLACIRCRLEVIHDEWKRGRTRITRCWFVLFSLMIGWKSCTSFLDQSKSEGKQINPGSLSTLNWKLLSRIINFEVWKPGWGYIALKRTDFADSLKRFVNLSRSHRQSLVWICLLVECCVWSRLSGSVQVGGYPGVPVHEGIPIVFITIHGVMTQFVNVSFFCVPVHEETTAGWFIYQFVGILRPLLNCFVLFSRRLSSFFRPLRLTADDTVEKLTNQFFTNQTHMFDLQATLHEKLMMASPKVAEISVF